MNKNGGEIERIRENVSKQKLPNKDQEGEKESNGSWKSFRTVERKEKSKGQWVRERRSNWKRKK